METKRSFKSNHGSTLLYTNSNNSYIRGSIYKLEKGCLTIRLFSVISRTLAAEKESVYSTSPDDWATSL